MPPQQVYLRGVHLELESGVRIVCHVNNHR